MEKNQKTKNLSQIVVSGILSAAFIALVVIGISNTVENVRDRRERVAYSRFEPGNTIGEHAKYFGAGHYLQGFDRDHNGTIDEIKLNYITAGGARMVVPCSHSYSVKDKEFKGLNEILMRNK